MCISNIKNAFENIVHACEKRLKELYPTGVPEIAETRYKLELGWLEKSKFIDDEVVKTHLFGIDLPQISCPVCHEELVGDGFNLPSESVWGSDGKKDYMTFDYNISSEFLPFAKRVLQKAYPENEIVYYGIMRTRWKDNSEPDMVEVKHDGYVILPKGRKLEDYPEITTYLEDGEPCISGFCNVLEQYNLKRLMLFSLEQIEHLMQLQRKSGIYVNEIGVNELRELTYYDLINSKSMSFDEDRMFSYEEPKNFHDMVANNAMGHNTTFVDKSSFTKWYYELKEKMLNNADFKKYPCATREDFFEYLLECGVDRETAYRVTEMIRKGKSQNNTEFDAFSIPEELKNVAKMYQYVFPRAHCIEYVMMYARMAYYMKWNSRVYSSVIGKNKKRL